MILNFLKSLFKEKPVRQSGFLYERRPTDYILGTTSPLSGEDLNLISDWVKYAPEGERQYKDFTFDTKCCSTFSGTSALEALFKFYLDNGYFSAYQTQWLKDFGYLIDGVFNFSDRFSAISNGTMPNGQYLQNVWDDFRKTGLIPEADLPFSGNNQAEYLDKSKVTQAMRDKAKRFLEVMFDKWPSGGYKINYEWVPVETGIELNTALKQAPIQVAVTKSSPTHAIVLLAMTWEFDSYLPFLMKRTRTIAYALKPIVGIKKGEVTKKYKYFADWEIVGLKSELVEKLDQAREKAGIPFVITSGKRTTISNAEVGGVNSSAHLTGEAVDLRARDSHEHYLITKALLEVGITRISRGYPKHIHCDIAKDKPQEVLF